MTFYRRNLPHWIPDGKVIFLTWRLYGSLPKSVGRRVIVSPSDAQEKFLALDHFLDSATSGPLWLSDPEIADYAQYPIEAGAELGRYLLHAYVIMLNHVHILLEPRIPLAKISGVMKGVAAPFWCRRPGAAARPLQ